MIAPLFSPRSGGTALLASILAALLGGIVTVPAQTMPPPSPVAGHLVGTILGEPETRGLSDFRTEADLLDVTDFAFLPNGDMVVADAVQNRVFAIGPDGILKPFAGTGSFIASGDGGSAVNAGVSRPLRLAVDGTGNLFIVEERGAGSVIRRVAPDGIIQAFAGSGSQSCPELGATAATSTTGRIKAVAAAADGTVYFFSEGCQILFRIGTDGVVRQAGVEPGTPPPASLDGTIGVPASSLVLSSVDAMTVDASGNLNVAVSHAPGIIRVTPAGVAITLGRITGGGPREGPLAGIGFARPLAIAAIPGGGLAIAQTDAQVNGRAEVGLASPADEYTILLAQDGYAGKNEPLFQGLRINPDMIRVSPAGVVFVRDSFSQAIFRVSAAGVLTHFLRTFRRGDPAIVEGSAPLLRSTALTNLMTDADGNIYFGDRVLQRLYRLEPDGVLTRVAGSAAAGAEGDGGPALEATLTLGARIAIDGQKRLYFLSSASPRLRRVTIGGNIETVLGGGQNPLLAEGSLALSVALQSPVTWAVAPTGQVYFHQQSQGIHRIWRVDSEGKLERFAGGGASPVATPLDGVAALNAQFSSRPGLLEVDPAGTLFFNLLADPRIFRVDSEGVIRAVVQGGGGNSITSGVPSLSSLIPFVPPLVPSAAGAFLALAGNPGVLAEYVAGGNVQVLRRMDAGTAKRDGGLLGDDMLVYHRSFAPLPGGALVWEERGSGFAAIRRSFPVPEGCTYTVNATELNVGGSNALTNLTLTTGNNCPWTVGTSANWLKILTNRTGKGSTTVQLNTLGNPSPSPRTGTVWIAGKSIAVTQAASTRTDIFLVSPSAATVPATGGAVTVNIVASPQQSWQVSLPGVPVGFEGAAAGSGSSQFTVTVPALPAGAVSRTLFVGVNASSVAITQTVPPTPVPYTLTSNVPGQSAIVDLVERTLPFQTQWVPGSTHLVRVGPLVEQNANTRIQFMNWPDGSTETERVLIAPAGSSQVALAFRRQYRLSTNTNLGSLPYAQPLVLSLPSEPTITGLPSPPAADGTRYAWFPEGHTVQVLALNLDGLKFVNFTGAVSTTANPVTITMDQPRQLLASYTRGNVLSQDLRTGGLGRWRFPDSARLASPAQITVDSTEEAMRPLNQFVSYTQTGGATGWLQLRPSGPNTPHTLELGIDPVAAGTATSGEAQVYLHHPDVATVSVTAIYSQMDASSGDAPRITAVTDAGGFRQAVLDKGYPQTSLVAAPGMILTLFGENLATGSGSAGAVPLPLNLAGTSVERLRLLEQDWVPVPLFYVSPGQINFQLPPDLSVLENQEEEIRLRVRRGATVSGNETRVMMRSRSMSLFSANSSGAGAPAGFAVRVRASGQQERSNLFLCGNGQCTPNPAPMGGAGDELFLELFGTGFRNRGEATQMKAFIGTAEAEITFAGPHPTFMGLDQANVKVPRDAPRGQDVDLYIWVRNGAAPWIASNRLTLRFQ